MESKGVRISLNKQRALHVESKLAFFTIPRQIFSSLSASSIEALGGNEFDIVWLPKPTRPRKTENC